MAEQESITRRLRLKKYDAKECDAAIRGERVSEGLAFDVVRLCVIRGIRHHYGFAEHLRGVTPEFTRALNVRDIMSNIIPQLDVEKKRNEIPYCFWYPDVPSQATLRELAARYPSLIYHIARACAVAGYADLYLELDVLLEVSVAEDARDASDQNQGSQAIFEDIMAHPVKYSILDDYTGTDNIMHPRVAHLNDDTAVRSTLCATQRHNKPLSFEVRGFDSSISDDESDDCFDIFAFACCGHSSTHYFNITEDWGVDISSCQRPKPRVDAAALLSTPLPTDLPAVNKDLLILMAAYEGNIDRYTRLRRPQMIAKESVCVISGIYHHPLFAMWWAAELNDPNSVARSQGPSHFEIERAVNARRIMSDDLTTITAYPRAKLPYNIWFPDHATPTTYEALARIRPDMLHSCLRACIVADYRATWSRLWSSLLGVSPRWEKEQLDRIYAVVTRPLYCEARDSRQPCYLSDISGVPGLVERCKAEPSDWESALTAPNLPKGRSLELGWAVFREVDSGLVWRQKGIYDGAWVEVRDLELTLFAREAVFGPNSDRWKDERRVLLEELYGVGSDED